MRRALRDLPLRQKIALLAIATMAAAQLLAGAGVLVWDLFAARRLLAADLETQARIIVDNVAPALAFGDDEAAEETLRALRLRRGFIRACLYDSQSQLFAFVSVDGECAATPSSDVGGFDGAGINIITPVLAPERGRIGTLTLRSSFAPVSDGMRAQTVAIVIVMVLSSTAAIFLTRRFHRVLTTPLLDLATTAQAVSRDRDYTHRVEKTTGDEIGAVAEAFNDMMAQVQHRDAELQRALRLKDEFLATVSHELRTPLNAIVGWVHVFRSPNVPPELAAQAADAIDRNAQRQVRLIEDILDVSRIVTGKLRLEPKPVDLAQIMEAALDVIQPTAAAKDIDVSVDLVKPAPMRGDPDRLQQIMWNLLANAVKFTPRGGRVWVSLDEQGDTYRAVVRDSGPGIPPDFVPHIFEAFRQADGSMTRTHGGLGLGLAIARHLTELSGGRIEAHSDGPGSGASFAVLLPRPADEPKRLTSADPAAAAWPRLDGVRVLLVDDDEDTRRVLSALLHGQGADIVTAASVAEAREALGQRVPDVVISDLAMPEEDGYALLHYCRHHASAELRELRLLALTAYAGEQARESVLRAGFDGYLAKPIDPGAVSRTIAATASSARR
jgi:signal transduction histidine kinase/ActR/RegA family two-component response regulator